MNWCSIGEMGKMEWYSCRLVAARRAMDTILLDLSGSQMKVRSVTNAAVRVR